MYLGGFLHEDCLTIQRVQTVNILSDKLQLPMMNIVNATMKYCDANLQIKYCALAVSLQ